MIQKRLLMCNRGLLRFAYCFPLLPLKQKQVLPTLLLTVSTWCSAPPGGCRSPWCCHYSELARGRAAAGAGCPACGPPGGSCLPLPSWPRETPGRRWGLVQNSLAPPCSWSALLHEWLIAPKKPGDCRAVCLLLGLNLKPGADT